MTPAEGIEREARRRVRWALEWNGMSMAENAALCRRRAWKVRKRANCQRFVAVMLRTAEILDSRLTCLVPADALEGQP